MNLYSITDTARITGISENRIHHAHRSGKLRAPTYFVAGKRIYTDRDLHCVANHFGVDLQETNKKENR